MYLHGTSDGSINTKKAFTIGVYEYMDSSVFDKITTTRELKAPL